MKKNDPIYNLLINAAIFIVVLIALDQFLGYVVGKFYFHQKKGPFAEMTYAIDSTKADVLIFGSSRALHHYSTEAISKGLGMTCYNTGSNGQKLPYAAIMQQVILKRYQPRIMILDLLLWDIQIGKDKFDKLSVLLPYCQEHPELRQYISEDSKYDDIKMLSKTYPYNSFLLPGIYNNLFASKLPKTYNGYLPLNYVMDKAAYQRFVQSEKADSISYLKTPDERIDEKAVSMYRDFLTNAQKHHIKTYLVLSPFIVPPSIRFKTKLQMLKKIAAEYSHATFLDFSTDPEFTYQYIKYADEFHLNGTGAGEFSKKLVTQLK
jgi:hypothetical protein